MTLSLLGIVLALTFVETLALLKGIDGTALAAFWGAIGVLVGVAGRKIVARRKK